mgnify:CR=1 FL=1
MAYSTTYITTQGAILAAKTLQSKTISFSNEGILIIILQSVAPLHL